MMPQLHGRAAYVFQEDNFDVDRIIGFDAMRAHDMPSMMSAAMTAFDPRFRETVRPGDFLIGGSNFGYGHPHGPPMAVMREMGIAAVIADSFAPLYLMGEMAAGFPQLTCPGASSRIGRGDVLSVDWLNWLLFDETAGFKLPIKHLTAHERNLIACGGLLRMLSATP